MKRNQTQKENRKKKIRGDAKLFVYHIILPVWKCGGTKMPNTGRDREKNLKKTKPESTQKSNQTRPKCVTFNPGEKINSIRRCEKVVIHKSCGTRWETGIGIGWGETDAKSEGT